MASNPNHTRANALPQRPHAQHGQHQASSHQGQHQASSHTHAASSKASSSQSNLSAQVKHYEQLREQTVQAEAAMGFEHVCHRKATTDEIKANLILQQIKQEDLAIYRKHGARPDSLGQAHEYFYGDHFLSNVGLIEQTALFKLCQAMPKGAHLHIHFNANLAPGFLLGIAKNMTAMYIWSSEPLTDRAAFARCRIQFSILGPGELKAKNPAGAANLFSRGYKAYPQQEKGCGWMLFKDFFTTFPSAAGQVQGVDSNVDRWLQHKLVFHEEETHNSLQTADGAWKNFNTRTQMMKGLFNYKTAYVRYTQACLAEFARDNIQYAEIRPNFMQTNQVWEDEGSGRLDNEAIMRLIIAEYEAFQQTHRGKVFKGLKIIYCTPRSFGKDMVRLALNECLKFKRMFPEYIAGFDLVGEESKGFPLRHFTEEFLQFQSDCSAAHVSIPFLFHCGETLDKGTDTDGNLYDALLLGAKRIGHGFALAWHPLLMQKMKERGVCVELCPISNEILGLTPRVGGHAAYTLLANNVACTISTDNSTPFQSTLSHDFYQIMAGKRDMTLFGFRQLIEWSIEHSCLESAKKIKVKREWEAMWDAFVAGILKGAFGGRQAGASSSSSVAAPSGGGPGGGSGSSPGSGPGSGGHHVVAGHGGVSNGRVGSSSQSQGQGQVGGRGGGGRAQAGSSTAASSGSRQTRK
ncbi:Metallo-dependent hydrolase [Parathielavia hyrcaniae]|uniref:adenosine deaminase n=1 Tax=Parathielavia hyrcaniae TaxID=113614 RepID=A0AAN6PR37_9PEZI|nr:Metallo-dependent hydrolase [Parathielavia hyrcaniae]